MILLLISICAYFQQSAACATPALFLMPELLIHHELARPQLFVRRRSPRCHYSNAFTFPDGHHDTARFYVFCQHALPCLQGL